jgi:WD40 repeat protein
MPDGQHIVSGSKDKTLRMWCLNRGSEYSSFRRHYRSEKIVAATPDGKPSDLQHQ